MANNPHPVLWCLIKDNSNLFKVTAPVDIDIDQLKELVWEKGKNGVLSGTDEKYLALYKVSSEWLADSTQLTPYL
jgi:Crinkler effector protein N-terminal domain